MEILGVGPLEIILVFILALVVLGPQDMVATARKIGLWVRKFTRSEMWAEIMDTSREIRQIPNALLRDTGLQDAANDLKKAGSVMRGEVNEAAAAIESSVQQAGQQLIQDAAAGGAQTSAVQPAPPAPPAPTGMPPLSPEIPRVQPHQAEQVRPAADQPPGGSAGAEQESGAPESTQPEPEA